VVPQGGSEPLGPDHHIDEIDRERDGERREHHEPEMVRDPNEGPHGVLRPLGPGAYLASTTERHLRTAFPNAYTGFFGAALGFSAGGPGPSAARRARASFERRRTIRRIAFSRRTSATW